MRVWKVATAAALVLLTGCTAVVPASPAASLQDTSWVVAEILGKPTLADFPPTMSFDASQVGGRTGCNGYGGSYTLSGTKLSVSELAQTQMACQDDRMQQEADFGEAFGTVRSVRFVGDKVELLDADGQVALLLVPVPPLQLAGTSWVLGGLIEGDTTTAPVEGDPVTLTFDADRVSGKACNSFGGPYTLSGDQLAIGPLSSTLMACLTEELNQQEGVLLEVLQSVTTAKAEYGTLTLTAPDGRGLQFVKA